MLKKYVNDKDLRQLVSRFGGCDLKNGPWIAGGTARRLWFGEPWKDHDVDVFFPNCDLFKKTENYVETRFSTLLGDDQSSSIFDIASSIVIDISKKPNKRHETNNAITYHVKTKIQSDNHIRLQLIKKSFYNTIESVWNEFDVTVCKFATDGKVVVADEQAIDDCNARLLRINQSFTKNIKVRRVIKYAIYGFNPERRIMEDLLRQHQSGELLTNSEDIDDYA